MKKIISIFIGVMFFASLTAQQVIKGTYAIKNVETGMVLRIKDANTKNGTPIVAYNPVDWKCVTWDFQHVEGQTYQLKNLYSGKTLQPVQAVTNGITLEEQPLTNNSTQLYEFIPAENNTYLIKIKDKDLYLTTTGKDAGVNSPIILAKKDGSKLQQWTIHEQHPTM